MMYKGVISGEVVVITVEQIAGEVVRFTYNGNEYTINREDFDRVFEKC